MYFLIEILLQYSMFATAHYERTGLEPLLPAILE